MSLTRKSDWQDDFILNQQKLEFGYGEYQFLHFLALLGIFFALFG
jgi:hypothetical protein